MADPYFAKFPTITYGDKFVKDLTKRVVVEQPVELPVDVHPYTIQDYLRADHVAELYYEDSRVDWLIYLTNDIIDPYGDWFLSPSQLEEILKEKYGSVERAHKTILYYENNWYNSPDQEISVSQYENVIPASWRKYYSPNFGRRHEVLSYSRKKTDTRVNTNRTIDYSVTLDGDEAFALGEKVDFRRTGQDAQVGTGELVFSNSSVVRVRSVSGDVAANSTATKTIVGEDSGAEATASSFTVTHENFSLEEGVFWSAVTAYDVEVERNEKRKHLRLIDRDAYQLVVNRVEELLDGGSDTTE